MEAIVEYNYQAQEPDELTLKKGDIIKEIKVMIGGWWEGTLRDKRGMFPDNFVKMIEPSGAACGSGGSESGSESTTANIKPKEVASRNKGSEKRWCKVLYSYEPCNVDELKLVPQDTIEFLGEVEDGWWKGRLKGEVGVFPSNFVTPVYEELEKPKETEKNELCKVLYPYEAANEDELTLEEGQIITLLSKDAPDKGWWKGELRGQVGLFPDNFVKILDPWESQEEYWQETIQSTKSVSRHSHQMKKVEKAHARRSLDTRDGHMESKKTITTSTIGSSGSIERKSVGNHPILSSLKKFVGDSGSNNGNGSTNVALGEELDKVERGEGAPLSHLTASRAKAPCRRPPSSQHLRHHASTATSPISMTPTNTISESNVTNGNADISESRDDENDGIMSKVTRKAPWVKELKMNQMERRKITSPDRVNKVEVKKERTIGRLPTPINRIDNTVAKQDAENEDNKQNEKKQNLRTGVASSDNTPVASCSPGHQGCVPYSVYNQLLDRVIALEDRQAVLQLTVAQLTEQFQPLFSSTNGSSSNKM
ncbi:SH3 domain-containing kinase-binding protein 1-like [Prorops nasuta]|uniref:SH3 domain-containing kinase-binding protein 1-like n=1 Tax=Prorops nasuta TaxID=863751 RepID=UPI0034CD4E57